MRKYKSHQIDVPVAHYIGRTCQLFDGKHVIGKSHFIWRQQALQTLRVAARAADNTPLAGLQDRTTFGALRRDVWHAPDGGSPRYGIFLWITNVPPHVALDGLGYGIGAGQGGTAIVPGGRRAADALELPDDGLGLNAASQGQGDEPTDGLRLGGRAATALSHVQENLAQPLIVLIGWIVWGV